MNNIQSIKNCKSNNNKDINSFSYLIERNLSQSDCIKLGIAFEKFLCDLIIKKTNLKNIKMKNIKGKKEKDHLFIDDENKIIYYAELKTNINLDTEKSKSTYNKCLLIVNELTELYPSYNIKWCLLGCRYISNNDIPKNIKKKYETINDNLFGINEYLSLLNINFKFIDEDDYKKILNNISNKMFG